MRLIARPADALVESLSDGRVDCTIVTVCVMNTAVGFSRRRGLGSAKIRDQRSGLRFDDVWAAYTLDRPPSLNAEIALRRWQALNTLLQSLVLLHAESRSRGPQISALQSACLIGAAKRGLLYSEEEGSRSLRIAATVGFGKGVSEAIRESNVMAAAAIRRSKPIVVNEPRDSAVRAELEPLETSCCISVPLLRSGRPWGAIQVLRNDPFGEDEAIVLWMYALILEGVLPVLFESAIPAGSPPSSGAGLVDIEHFETRLKWEIERSGWLERPMCLARLTWESKVDVAPPGAAQRPSPGFVRVLRRTIRPSDLIAARTDNELLIAMPGRFASEVHKLLGPIRRRMGRERGGDSPDRLGVKVVVVSYPQDGRQCEDLFRSLDAQAGILAVEGARSNPPVTSVE